jgi:23S rRNA (uracil1939-C5)-methyltransferase
VTVRVPADSGSPVRIERLAAGGDGIGRLADGRAVFVPRTAPGDLAELEGIRLHKRFARARLARVIEPGPDRVEPPCPHYRADDCGGCQLQHLGYPAQVAAKSAIVGDALRRLAGLSAADPAVEPAASPFEYRTKLTLAIGAGGRRIGLHRYDRPAQVFDLAWCHITRPELNQLWQAASRLRRQLPRDATHLVLRLDRAGGVHLIVRSPGGGEPWAGGVALQRALARAQAPAVVWWHPEGGAARAMAGAGEAFPATVFEQVNPAMGDRARAAALAALGPADGRHVWDLYAGIGETTDRLAAAGATVESVESDRRAVAWGEAHGPGRPAVTRHAGRVEDLLPELRRPALVVTNPPRSGMDERAVTKLAASAAERIVYVSCDPGTLARDVARLGDRWRLGAIRAFDLFPQTAHVETVATLERA